MCILIIGEQAEGKLKKSTFSAVTFARLLAERQGLPYHIALAGSGLDAAAAQAAASGAASVVVADDPALGHYLAMPWAAAIAAIAKELGAPWVVMTATTTGKDVMPRVAVKLEAGLASDVIRADGEGSTVRLIRPMWAGNVLTEVDIQTAVKCVTVRGSDWDAAAATGGASPVNASPGAGEAARGAGTGMRYVSFEASGGDRPELNDADAVVAGGRGLKSEANFHILDELADVLGGAIGASRAAVDSGYAPNDYQIGQTGKSVAPNLYIAVAISGAIQHVAGMKSSKVIVAINKDPEAPIFQIADYGLVADAFTAVPELAAKIRAAKA